MKGSSEFAENVAALVILIEIAKKGRAEVHMMVDEQKATFRRRFHCTSLVDHSHPLFVSEPAAFLHKHRRKTTKINFQGTEDGPRYFIMNLMK